MGRLMQALCFICVFGDLIIVPEAYFWSEKEKKEKKKKEKERAAREGKKKEKKRMENRESEGERGGKKINRK
ncbi:hypothetical protein ERO13_D01G106050v2 [Gossypium hirsutum]|uniref:Uncharacterized protein n=1 Tax=Gossypium mustelinum TaxID=34275 RepID=A0A5D2W6T3_GOSMU|nr:hypothetical protein ERO13_D01G106050v2 [Gossypium hirsutum]TYI97278.1 hypothetical protein E1A91_D01G132500v1 [Gossypium mustelinum]